MLRRLEMGIAIPRDLGWAIGMAAARKGRMARTKECEKYMLDWKRFSRLQMSGRGQKALGAHIGYVRCFIAVGWPSRKVGWNANMQ